MKHKEKDLITEFNPNNPFHIITAIALVAAPAVLTFYLAPAYIIAGALGSLGMLYTGINLAHLSNYEELSMAKKIGLCFLITALTVAPALLTFYLAPAIFLFGACASCALAGLALYTGNNYYIISSKNKSNRRILYKKKPVETVETPKSAKQLNNQMKQTRDTQDNNDPSIKTGTRETKKKTRENELANQLLTK